MSMEPGIINVEQEIPAIGTMNQKLGFVSMILSATGMGLVGAFGRLSTPVDPATGSKYIIGDFLAAGRMMVGVLGFLLIIVALEKWSELRRVRISPAIIGGGLAIGASLALYVSATLMTTIANAVFLIYTGPLFATILARIFLKERVGLRKGIFFSLVFTGMLFTVGLVRLGGGSVVSFGLQLGAVEGLPRKPLGDLFGLGSGVFYGLALFFYRYRGDVSSEVRGFWNFVFGTVGASVVLALRIMFLDQTNPVTVMTGRNWLWAIVLFVVCGLGAIGLLVVAGKNLKAVELATTAYWECVIALLLGWLVWGESLTLTSSIGGALILLGGAGPVVFELFGRERLPEGERSVPDCG